MLIPMQPSPTAETSRLLFPSLRFCIVSPSSVWIAVSMVKSQFLARWPEQDLVHVNVLRLADRERDCASERLGRNRDLVDLAHVLGDIRLGHALGQCGGDRARRDHSRADVVGLYFQAQPFGQGQYGMLGGRIDRAAGADLVTRDRRDVDEMAGLLL